MEPAQKSDSCRLRLEHTQKRPSPTDMLWLFSFESHAIQNSLWPQEQLSSLSQSTPCWNLKRKSRFNALSTCEWQLYPQKSLGATLISLSALTRFWVGKIGANQVWKVLCPAPNEIRRRTFLKVYMTSKGHLETTYSHIGSCLPRHFDDPKCSGSTDARWQNL